MNVTSIYRCPKCGKCVEREVSELTPTIPSYCVESGMSVKLRFQRLISKWPLLDYTETMEESL